MVSATTGDPGNDQSSNNSSGFNAFPVGFRGTSYEDGAFVYESINAVFWSSTENGIGTRTLSMTSKSPFQVPWRELTGRAFQCVLLGIKNLDLY